MNNWKLRLGAALSALGLSVVAIAPQDLIWSRTGLIIAAVGVFFKSLFPETDGGAQAAAQLPPNLK